MATKRTTKKQQEAPKTEQAEAIVHETETADEVVTEAVAETIADEASAPAQEPTQGKKRGRPPRSQNKPSAPIDVAVGTAQQISLDKIDLSDETFKYRVGGLRTGPLKESIREQGQQFPILLRQSPTKPNLYQIISGFRRTTALKELKWNTVNAIIRDDLDDDVKACQVSVVENEIRKTYNDLDRAHAILAYREMGKSNAEIEKLFKIGSRQRQRLSKLTEFPEVLQEAVASGDVLSTHAVRLMQHVDKYPDTDVAHWIKRINDEAMSYIALNKALKEAVPDKVDQDIEFFVKNEKDGKESLRIRSISISEELTDDQKKKLEKDLREVLAFLKQLK